jgi:hypothetical protein
VRSTVISTKVLGDAPLDEHASSKNVGFQTRLTLNRPDGERPPWPLLGVLPPRLPHVGEAEIDPKRRFATVN